MRRVAALVLVLFAAPCLATPTATTYGPLEGKLSDDGRVAMWLGIPYAAPPVGELRWRAPQPPAPWTEVRSAVHFGDACAQIGTLYGPPPAGKAWGPTNVEAFGRPVGSEDCLTLNVWRPNTDAQGLPVLVFVHGGGGIAGYSGDPMYESSRLALATSAVVVTINMRLGVFASLVHPALQGNDPLSNSGHFGTLDIIQALRFVHDNGAAFGGDSDNVTLAGESAGAIAVYMMMASPLAKGLFHKAIVMSGLFGDLPTKEKSLKFSSDLLSHLLRGDHLSPPPSDIAEYLRSRSTSEILEVVHEGKLRSPGAPGDGVVLPTDLVAAFEQGNFNRVPTIVGTTRDEAKLLAGVFKPTDAERFAMMQTPELASAATPSDLIKPYLLPALGDGLYNAYTRTITWLLKLGVESSVKKLALHAPKVYRYQFDWDRQPEPWHTVYGACHAIDLPFLFGNFSGNLFAPFFTERNRAGYEALSQAFVRSVDAFLRTADPNTPALTQTWPAWTEKSPSLLHLDASDQALAVSISH